ncbi:MAG: ABC transporter permease [Candidatus Lambdaproteobacteria bacterium]|nr:ABC transporter permease [Candidatus Lambdaproteobacteria bacterium]
MEQVSAKVDSPLPAAATGHARLQALGRLAALLVRDRFALVAFLVLVVVIGLAVFGAPALKQMATQINLRGRNLAPFTLDNGFFYVLGADILGRSMVARLILASGTTLAIAVSAVTISLLTGTLLGLYAGYSSGWSSMVIMRITDTVMSFPSLLMAVIVLYLLRPNALNVVLVLAITRMPVYIRVTRAEVLEVRERTFVEAAQAAGASDLRVVGVHILPVVLPTLLTVATLDFANVMLNESALSFLGIGVQPPDVTWGLMVAEGRNYLSSAWWLAAFPGLAIMITTLAANLLSNFMRFATDPVLRTRLESRPPP